jgi:hypothetical protein
LRARYLHEALIRSGWESSLHCPPLKNRSLSLEALCDIPGAALHALFRRLDLAIGIKPYPNVFAALAMARQKGALCVLDVDDLDAAWRPGLTGRLAALAQWPALHSAFRLSTHHPAIAKELGKLGSVLPLGQGVDTKIFSPGKKSKENLLLYAAHLNVASQLEQLLQWLQPWLVSHPEWRLVVAGGGPLLGSYRRQFASPQIEFTGALSVAEVAAWVRRARLCLAAYDQNPGNAYRVPMKVGEYLACARPVLCNWIPGLKNLRPYLYLSRSEGSDFRRQLDRLSRGGGDGRELRGSRYVRRRLSWDAILGEFMAALP